MGDEGGMPSGSPVGPGNSEGTVGGMPTGSAGCGSSAGDGGREGEGFGVAGAGWG